MVLTNTPGGGSSGGGPRAIPSWETLGCFGLARLSSLQFLHWLLEYPGEYAEGEVVDSY